MAPEMTRTTMVPVFSIIIPTFNRAALLPRAVRSVLNQTLSDFELVIVDDGSTDQTAPVIDQIDDPRIRYFHQPNRGRSAARNAGAALACGQYLTFLDSDDEAYPTWLEQYAGAFQEHQVGIVCVGCHIVEAQSTKTVLPDRLGALFEEQTGLFLAGTFSLKREIFESVGGYVELLDFSENTELAFRLVEYCTRTGCHIASIYEPLLLYHYAPEYFAPRRFESRLDSAAYILEHHRQRLYGYPPQNGVLAGLAGVNAARLGRYREARRFFTGAIRVEPRNWKHYSRLLLALIPPLARRFWLRQEGHQSLDSFQEQA